MNATEYTYVLPEGYELKPEHRAKLDKLVEETGLSNEHAQAFVDLHIEIVSEEV